MQGTFCAKHSGTPLRAGVAEATWLRRQRLQNMALGWRPAMTLAQFGVGQRPVNVRHVRTMFRKVQVLSQVTTHVEGANPFMCRYHCWIIWVGVCPTRTSTHLRTTTTFQSGIIARTWADGANSAIPLHIFGSRMNIVGFGFVFLAFLSGGYRREPAPVKTTIATPGSRGGRALQGRYSSPRTDGGRASECFV